MNENQTAGRKTLRKLTHAQFFKLVEAVKTHRDGICTMTSWSGAAEFVSAKMKEADKEAPAVPDSSLREACQLVDPAIVPKRGGKNWGTGGKTSTRDDLEVLVRLVDKLVTSHNLLCTQLSGDCELQVIPTQAFKRLVERANQ